MSKLFALVMAGTLLVAHVTPALGNESAVQQCQKSDGRSKDFTAFLPAPAAKVPWLNLDAQTKLPKGDFPLGREAGSIGLFALEPTSPSVQVSSNAQQGDDS
jgi:hypothetical protein